MVAMQAHQTDADQRQERAERTFWQKAMVGGAIGMIAGAVVYAGIVAIALVGSGSSLGPAVWMGAGVGVFGGLFLGAWAGVMAGLGQLEETEHDLMVERRRR